MWRNIMKNRSRIDIAAAILQVAQGGSKKTNILYKAFVSTPQIKEYFGLLMKQGLMEYVKEERMYYTTEKEMQVLTMYRQAIEELYPRSRPAIAHLCLA
jgi:predicted transcriptional regulator